jgi:hypothetical protein
MKEAWLQKAMEVPLRKIGRELKCRKLRLEHLADDFKKLCPQPTKAQMDALCAKHERKTKLWKK